MPAETAARKLIPLSNDTVHKRADDISAFRAFIGTRCFQFGWMILKTTPHVRNPRIMRAIWKYRSSEWCCYVWFVQVYSFQRYLADFIVCESVGLSKCVRVCNEGCASMTGKNGKLLARGCQIVQISTY